jgi:drug/metabolite transporter (DMT)-like permease
MIARTSPLARAWIGLLLAAVFWAGNALVARAVRDDIPPLSLSFWRWSLALGILLPFVAPTLWRERERIRRGGWRLLVLSAIGIGVYNVLLYMAAHTTEAINLTLVSTCLPLATFVGAGLLLRDWPPQRAWYGLAVAAVGLIWLISRGELGRLLALRFNAGDLLMLLAVADWALYSVLLRRWAAWVDLPALPLLGLMILLCVPMLLPFYLYELFTVGGFEVTVGNLGAIGYTSICASLVAYFAWTYGVRVVGASKAALTSYLMPVFTALLGWLLLGEHLQSFHWVGAALIFSGLLLATRTNAR